jgi:hypothetical protein
MRKRRFFLIGLIIPAVVMAKPTPPCRTLPGYQFRYAFQDKKNPANNSLWLEDAKGFRIVELKGADCGKLTIVGGKVYWIEYPGHVINSFDMKTRLYDSFSEGGQFVISPDGQRMVIERAGVLSMVTLATKNEVDFLPLPERALNPGEYAVVFVGWSQDSKNFWFAPAAAKNRALDLQVLTHQGDLITTNLRTDPLLEAVFNLSAGWITQSNGTELSVFDLMGERKALIDNCTFGEKFRPRWMSGGHLKYFKDGQEKTIFMKDIQSRLDAASSSASTIAKREFVPISW